MALQGKERVGEAPGWKARPYGPDSPPWVRRNYFFFLTDFLVAAFFAAGFFFLVGTGTHLQSWV
jgi:hypothetical protein